MGMEQVVVAGHEGMSSALSRKRERRSRERRRREPVEAGRRNGTGSGEGRRLYHRQYTDRLLVHELVGWRIADHGTRNLRYGAGGLPAV